MKNHFTLRPRISMKSTAAAILIPLLLAFAGISNGQTVEPPPPPVDNSTPTVSDTPVTESVSTTVETTKNNKTDEGYKGVPWGYSFEQFKALKEVKYTNDIYDEDWGWGSGQNYTNKLQATGIDYLLFENHFINEENTENEGLNNFKVSYSKPEDTDFIFYNDGLVLCYSEIESKNSKKVTKLITEKYKLINVKTADVLWGTRPDGLTEYMEYKFSHYRKNPMTRIYIVKVLDKIGKLEPNLISSMVVYVSEEYFKQTAYQALQKERKKAKNEEKEEIEKQNGKDINKVE